MFVDINPARRELARLNAGLEDLGLVVVEIVLGLVVMAVSHRRGGDALVHLQGRGEVAPERVQVLLQGQDEHLESDGGKPLDDVVVVRHQHDRLLAAQVLVEPDTGLMLNYKIYYRKDFLEFVNK